MLDGVRVEVLLAAITLACCLTACSRKPAAPAKPSPAASSADRDAIPGPDFASAAPLTLGVAVTASIQNTARRHFYKVENALKARDRALLRFESLSSALKPDVKIYDSNRVMISERYDATPGASLEYAFTLEPNQPVFIEVLPYASSGRYRLALSAQSAFDRYEPNDAATPAEIKPGEDADANILDDKDEDWYRVMGAGGDKLAVNLENQSVTLKPHVKIYDANKNAVLEKFDAAPGSSLNFEAPTQLGQDIYVQVLPYGSSGKYKLSVQ